MKTAQTKVFLLIDIFSVGGLMVGLVTDGYRESRYLPEKIQMNVILKAK